MTCPLLRLAGLIGAGGGMRWQASSVPSASVRGVGELVRSTLSGREELELLRWSGRVKVKVERSLGFSLDCVVGTLSTSFFLQLASS